MAPSRGTAPTLPAPSTHPHPHHDSPDDRALTQQSRSAWTTVRRNFSYLLDPTKATTTGASPARLRTRALLRLTRSLTVFLFWRLIRWAKYAAVGALITAVSATAVGGFVSGVGWVVAPPTVGASVLMYGVWGVGKLAARRLHARWARDGGEVGEVERERREDGHGREETKADGRFGMDIGPQVVPW